MESPVRKMLKRNDYNRHKLLRKIKRRRKAAAEQQAHAAEKALKKRLKVTPPKYDEGKDEIPIESYKWYEMTPERFDPRPIRERMEEAVNKTISLYPSPLQPPIVEYDKFDLPTKSYYDNNADFFGAQRLIHLGTKRDDRYLSYVSNPYIFSLSPENIAAHEVAHYYDESLGNISRNEPEYYVDPQLKLNEDKISNIVRFMWTDRGPYSTESVINQLVTPTINHDSKPAERYADRIANLAYPNEYNRYKDTHRKAPSKFQKGKNYLSTVKNVADDINENKAFLFVKALDPTGVTSWYDVGNAAYDMYKNPNMTNAANLTLEVAGAIPLFGKVGKALKLGSAYASAQRIARINPQMGQYMMKGIEKEFARSTTPLHLQIAKMAVPACLGSRYIGLEKDLHDSSRYQQSKKK